MHTLLVMFFNSLFIYGIHTLFSEGYLLEKQGGFIERIIGTFWSKPLFTCPLCMASFWGSIGFFIFVQKEVIYWPLYCICLCGMNAIINDFKSKEFTINDSND